MRHNVPPSHVETTCLGLCPRCHVCTPYKGVALTEAQQLFQHPDEPDPRTGRVGVQGDWGAVRVSELREEPETPFTARGVILPRRSPPL